MPDSFKKSRFWAIWNTIFGRNSVMPNISPCTPVRMIIEDQNIYSGTVVDCHNKGSKMIITFEPKNRESFDKWLEKQMVNKVYDDSANETGIDVGAL